MFQPQLQALFNLVRVAFPQRIFMLNAQRTGVTACLQRGDEGGKAVLRDAFGAWAFRQRRPPSSVAR